MSDSFWTAFFTAVPILLGLWLAHVRQMRSLKSNTDLTVLGQETVCQKIDSATSEVNNTVTTGTAEVKKEAVQTAKVTADIAQRTANTANATSREVLKQLEPIAEKLNGGPEGLTSLSVRVASLEAKYDILSQGQADMVRSIDRLTDVLEHSTIERK